jgi:hypothetical protein
VDAAYHGAIVEAHVVELRDVVSREQWPGVRIENDGALVYATIDVERSARASARYVARIDMGHFPVWPYFVGFLDPRLARERWSTATDRDPRYWPYSPLPGLEGGFHIHYPGVHRVFWCQACTPEYFFYHRDAVWEPHRWALWRVVSHLRNALHQAEAPGDWRGIFRQTITAAAKQNGLVIPDEAGTGDA